MASTEYNILGGEVAYFALLYFTLGEGRGKKECLGKEGGRVERRRKRNDCYIWLYGFFQRPSTEIGPIKERGGLDLYLQQIYWTQVCGIDHICWKL